MSLLFINKTLLFNNLKTRSAINVKISVFVLSIEAVIYFLLCNLHDCIFKVIKIKMFLNYVKKMRVFLQSKKTSVSKILLDQLRLAVIMALKQMLLLLLLLPLIKIRNTAPIYWRYMKAKSVLTVSKLDWFSPFISHMRFISHISCNVYYIPSYHIKYGLII